MASIEPAGWGRFPELLLYPSTTGSAAGVSPTHVPTLAVRTAQQWGAPIADDKSINTNSDWEKWLRARLSALGVSGDEVERAFTEPAAWPAWTRV